MKTKQCTKCKVKKPVSEFGKHVHSPDGFSWWCRTCKRKNQNKLYQENRETILEKQKTYREKPENKTRQRKNRKRYYHENKESLKADVKRWQQNNPEKVYKTTKKYRKNHPEKARAHWAVSNAIRSNKLMPASHYKCSVCKTKQALDYHHYLGYSPENHLDVKPVCRECHKRIEQTIIP